MKPPTLAEAVFSLKSFAASMLALHIAMAMGQPRPFWAMLTAYVVSSPLSGAVRSKAAYRVGGTVIGSAAAVVLVPMLVDAPELLTLALGLWVALCLYISLLDRTPRSYMFMLAGYTVGLIGFQGVAAPATIFDTAVARVEEITLGILCATLVHSLILPKSLGPVLLGRFDSTLRDAERWTLDALSGGGEATSATERQRLARDVTELRVMSTHLPYDTSDVRWMVRPVRALQDRMAYLLPVLAAVEDRLAALRREAGGLSQELEAVLEEVRRWVADREAGGEAAGRLRAGLEGLMPAVGEGIGWRDAVLLNLLSRLQSLVTIHQDCRDLRDHIRSGERTLPDRLDPLTRARSRGVFHLDHGMALWSGAAALLGIAAVCGFWIATGWSSGSGAAMMVAVFCCFFASLDDPVPGIRLFLVFTILSLPIAGIYLLGILPAIDGFPMLVLGLAPTFLLLGAYAARPATTGAAMAMLFGVAGALSLQDTGTADFASFVNSSLAQIVGILAAILVTRLCRSVGAAWSARRLLRAGWREVASVAGAPSAPPPGSFENRMLDRVGLLSPRLALAGPQEDLAAADAVNDLRIGLNLAELQRARTALDRRTSLPLLRLLEGVERHFRTLSAGGHAPVPSALLADMDLSLSSVAAVREGAERARAVVALAGLRRSLFPDVSMLAEPMPVEKAP